MELVSRLISLVTSVVLMLLATGLMGYSIYQIFAGPEVSGKPIASRLLDAIGFVVIAIAVFDVAKYIVEEEVVRGRELRHAAEARRSLTKFISTIAIAVFLEALVSVFEASRQEMSNMIYPTLLMLTGILLIVGLGVFQRLSVIAEEATSGSEEGPSGSEES